MDETLWDFLLKASIQRVLLHVGLSASNPLGYVVVFLCEKFLTKFVKPEYDKSVAKAIEEYTELVEEAKLKKLKDAIEGRDRDKITDILDSLK